ncbi:MAG: hypothetical protein WCA46_22240 [Actinocatenispora sp.]
MTTVAAATSRPGRLRSAWTAAHAPVAGVHRWARIAAAAVQLTVLPACVWRICWASVLTITGHAEESRGQLPLWMPVLGYVVLLGIASELLAFTAYGMIARWGEVFPRWVLGLRGRRVPPLAAVIPAALGAFILTVLWTEAAVGVVLRHDIQGRPMSPDNPLIPHGWQGLLADACYAPLLLWGPLLGALTIAYWRRRRHS